ncbi:hypothetical protein DFH08DRAFT_694662 [Mycena albidolilacea]|uniref:Uncharacterized protein n=1 Tax=Mycena albidolilacea TaxID=1033008 RepID=A0AAD7A830_9AGAR|nr:hypothetical protein DFH08DRAFT_694662 [Mycena albidolilacea]
MRQTKTSEADENLRTCLANMRFGACTPSDLEYLRTRTISRRFGHPTFEDPRFRNVSIITALNAQKDKINEIGCQKFADETNQPLVHFYSEDTLTENAASESRKPQRVRKREVLKVKRKLSTHRQQQLWDAYPCSTSEHIPGKLSLFVGMPIMIRHNDATELCITKGQEGTVVGWQESLGSQDQTILDTLFVELIKPPRPIRVPGLPLNVVALTRSTKKLWCQLPDDLVVQVSREKVLVLPNFAMTDYASQGKTREFNVIDLNNCKNHFSYYTALSRGSSSDDTLIIQGMDERKITSGIDGHLRQEFRELEMLNEITLLRYHNNLPIDVGGNNRRDILQAFQWGKGGFYEPQGLDTHARWRKGDAPLLPPDGYQGKWTLVGDDTKKRTAESKKTVGHGKRKAMVTGEQKQPKKPKVVKSGPVGLVWDPVDHSCAYDAMFTALYDIWQAHGPKWSDRLKEYGVYVSALVQGFESCRAKTERLESARDRVREMLHRTWPNDFPKGPAVTAIDDLASKIFGSVDWGVSTVKCTRCNQVVNLLGGPGFCGAQTVVYDKELHSRCKFNYGIANWLTSRRMYKANRICSNCGNGLVVTTTLDKFLPCFYLSLSDKNVLLDPAVTLNVGEKKVRYMLRAVIYSGDSHFTSRVIKPDGSVWYHDGIETGTHSEAQGSFHKADVRFLNFSVRGEVRKTAASVIYWREYE